jgi:hypothetical protein
MGQMFLSHFSGIDGEGLHKWTTLLPRKHYSTFGAHARELERGCSQGVDTPSETKSCSELFYFAYLFPLHKAIKTETCHKGLRSLI